MSQPEFRRGFSLLTSRAALLVVASLSLSMLAWSAGAAPVYGVWTQLTPTQSPPARSFPAMTATPSGVTLFGGFNSAWASVFNDTWVFDPTTPTWTQRIPTGNVPETRVTRMVWNPLYGPSGKVILFGGANDTIPNCCPDWFLNDTWALDPAAGTWTNINATNRSDPALPHYRFHHAMVTTPSGAFLFGGGYKDVGNGSEEYPTDTWLFGAGPGWTNLAPTGSVPQGRYTSGVAWDAANEKVILFGGWRNNEATLGDTWSYDFTANAWTQWSPSTAPGVRNGPGMAFEPNVGRTVLFGGADWVAAKNDTWVFDWATKEWTEVTIIGTRPPVRYDPGMVYDAAQGKILLFGGVQVNPGTVLGDTWTLAFGPDLTLTKANDAGGPVNAGGSFKWTLHVANIGLDSTFASGQTILRDNLPTAGVTYGSLLVQNAVNIGGTGTIACAIDGSSNLSCTASGGTVIIGAGTGSFDVVFSATPTRGGALTNPRSGGVCRVDPDALIAEVNESNNDATDTVAVISRSFTGPVATGWGAATASFTGGSAMCTFSDAAWVPLATVLAQPPSATAFPHGLFSFNVTGCTPGDTLNFTLTMPLSLPAASQYWKWGPTAANLVPHWYTIPAVFAGNTITFSITDGGLGDNVTPTQDGSIVDPGGPGVPIIPLLDPSGLLALATLLALAGAFALGEN